MEATTREPDLPVLHRETVRPGWVDYNGHMNVAYYVLAFDHATDAFLDHVRLGEAYREETGGSVFVVEMHVTYEREVMQGTAFEITTQVLAAEGKRLHLFHRMYETGSDRIAASNEVMILHVDLATRRTAPFPEDRRATLDAMRDAHAVLPWPPQAGRAVGQPPAKTGA
jgi:acyl-CoA thioester hydrolase